MKMFIYNHNGGQESIDKKTQLEVSEAILSFDSKKQKVSSKSIRDHIIKCLKSKGWPSSFQISLSSDISITSLKNQIGLCLQTGNMARMYADLLKLQTLYLDNVIKAAFLILPSHPLALKLGSNIAQSNRLINELTIFKKIVYVPLVIYSLE